MANWASTTYVIEGPKETLQKIEKAITEAINTKDNKYEEYKVCDELNIPYEIGKTHLGGLIEEEPWYDDNGSLYFYAEERWGLQDFNELLEKKFPDIKVYWVVEEPGNEVYATNDKEGKYFPDRFYVDTCINGIYQSEYFTTEEEMYKWLSENTNGKIKSLEDAENFNESSDTPKEDFISIHEFEVE